MTGCRKLLQPVYCLQHLHSSTKKALARVPQLLIETRVRLVTGLKRYLHTKHGEGLLSAASVQVRPALLVLQYGGLGPGTICNGFRERSGEFELVSIAILCSLTGLRLATLAFLYTRQWGV